MDIEYIKAKIDELKQKEYWLKSLSYKKTEMNPVITDEKLTILEQTEGISLPISYREFITKVGNGGVGAGYGLLSLKESMVDFKLETKPEIDCSKPFRYFTNWNESWIFDIDWDNGERPTDEQLTDYMSVSHLDGCLQIGHIGHGCTYLLVLNGEEKGNIWTDDRADYGGINPVLDAEGDRVDFEKWYLSWIEGVLREGV